MSTTLFVRMDRIGDLVLSLPADQLEGLSGDICWWVNSSNVDVIELAEPKRKYFSSPIQFSFFNFLKAVRQLREQKISKAVVFYAPWWVYWALLIAGVRKRGGRLSQWYSFLLLNKGLRQKRSLSERHESQYNAELVSHFFGLEQSEMTSLSLSANSDLPSLENLKFQRPYFVVHPGMGKSALNWPASSYVQLIQKLSEEFNVLITGTSIDEPYLGPILSEMKTSERVYNLVGRLDIKSLVKVLSEAEGVLAPSTGVLHLAASTGVRTVGLYSDVLEESSTRWGPRGPNAVALDVIKQNGQPTDSVDKVISELRA